MRSPNICNFCVLLAFPWRSFSILLAFLSRSIGVLLGFFCPVLQQGVTGHTISIGAKHLKTFYIFAVTSISCWFCMMCHFFIEACLMLGTDDSYCVTKSKMYLRNFTWVTSSQQACFISCLLALQRFDFLFQIMRQGYFHLKRSTPKCILCKNLEELWKVFYN